jgi:type I restriction-modification system DNA methylase subunit
LARLRIIRFHYRLNHHALRGWEIVDNTARLCLMNLYLHGIAHDSQESPIQEMIEDLEAAVEQLQMIVADLGESGNG